MKFIVLLLLGACLSKAMDESRHALLPEDLGKRAVQRCTHDNLYRIFLDYRYSSSASVFCSNFITRTSISNAMAKATAISNSSATDAPFGITSAVLAAQSLMTTTSPDPAITYVLGVKRQAVPAAFAPGKAGTYSPDRISSACSCLASPVVMIRQIAASTLISTQNWTRHFTRLTTNIETATSTTNIAAVSSRVLSPDSAPTTSATAASTMADIVAAPTSTIEPSAPTPPAAYCTAGNFFGPINGQTFIPLCGISYIPANPDPSTLNSVDSYMDCAVLCDADTLCVVFSYLLTTATDNCYVFEWDLPASTWDPNIDSGLVVIF